MSVRVSMSVHVDAMHNMLLYLYLLSMPSVAAPGMGYVTI